MKMQGDGRVCLKSRKSGTASGSLNQNPVNVFMLHQPTTPDDGKNRNQVVE